MTKDLGKQKFGQSATNLIVLVSLLILVAVFVTYYWYTHQISTDQTTSNTTGITLNTTDWSKTLFGNPVIQSLKSPITMPYVVGPDGNATPFFDNDKTSTGQ